jgi:hypothetical protein
MCVCVWEGGGGKGCRVQDVKRAVRGQQGLCEAQTAMPGRRELYGYKRLYGTPCCVLCDCAEGCVTDTTSCCVPVPACSYRCV